MGRYQPALLGGLFIGVLSTLPIVDSLNACCCLWVVTGGVLVTYLLQQNTPTPVATGEAALQGLIAGAIGALIMCAGKYALAAVTVGPDAIEQMRAAISSNNDLPPEMKDNAMRFLTGRNIVLIFVFLSVPMYAVFSMAGSFLGLAFFRKKVPPTPQV